MSKRISDVHTLEGKSFPSAEHWKSLIHKHIDPKKVTYHDHVHHTPTSEHPRTSATLHNHSNGDTFHLGSFDHKTSKGNIRTGFGVHIKEEDSQMLVKLAHEKNAVGFGKALVERLEQKVGQALAETKVEIAGTLLENPNGVVSDAEGGVKTKEQGGEVGKNRLPDTTDIKSSAGNPPPGGTKLAHVETKPGTSLAVDPKLPGKANEEVEKKEPHEDRAGSKGKRAIRMAMKKKYDKKRTDESTVLPQVDEKVISPGTVDHMAHAVHQCATGQHPVHSHRGTFTQYEHPHYNISKDHGGIDPDKAEHRYHVMGSGGHHVFTVHHSSKGVDVKHVGKH